MLAYEVFYEKALISNINSDSPISLEGIFKSKTILGDKSIRCNDLDFALINFRPLIGEMIQDEFEDGSICYSKGRILLECEDYEIILDKIEKEKERSKLLRRSGGFLQLYDGRIKIKKEYGINANELSELIERLASFLTFLNGRRVSPLLITAKFDDEIKWQDYTPYSTDSHEYCLSWVAKFQTEALNKLWKEFVAKWKSENSRDVLSTAIHWYVEANNNSGYVEGSLIMAQTALELLYNWHVIETKQMIIGNDAENISAVNKIRLLLSSLEYNDFDIPDKFQELKNFVNNSTQISNCIEAIVLIRNSVIHSQEKKRKELNKISNRAKYEALQMSIWYIEISILKILNYKGKIVNRTRKNLWLN